MDFQSPTNAFIAISVMIFMSIVYGIIRLEIKQEAEKEK